MTKRAISGCGHNFVKVHILVLLMTSICVSSYVANAEPRKCAVVQNQLQQIFTPKITEDEKVLAELWKRTARAYKMIFENEDCVPAKDLSEMKKFLKESKKGCIEARRNRSQNEFAWSLAKDMCNTLKPIYRYVR